MHRRNTHHLVNGEEPGGRNAAHYPSYSHHQRQQPYMDQKTYGNQRAEFLHTASNKRPPYGCLAESEQSQIYQHTPSPSAQRNIDRMKESGNLDPTAPGEPKDPNRIGMSKSQISYYRKYLREGLSPTEAMTMAKYGCLDPSAPGERNDPNRIGMSREEILRYRNFLGKGLSPTAAKAKVEQLAKQIHAAAQKKKEIRNAKKQVRVQVAKTNRRVNLGLPAVKPSVQDLYNNNPTYQALIKDGLTPKQAKMQVNRERAAELQIQAERFKRTSKTKAKARRKMRLWLVQREMNELKSARKAQSAQPKVVPKDTTSSALIGKKKSGPSTKELKKKPKPSVTAAAKIPKQSISAAMPPQNEEKLLRVTILPKNYPEEVLTPEKSTDLQEAILDEVAKGCSIELAFRGVSATSGTLQVICCGADTANWLKDIVTQLGGWNGCELRASIADDLPSDEVPQ